MTFELNIGADGRPDWGPDAQPINGYRDAGSTETHRRYRRLCRQLGKTSVTVGTLTLTKGEKVARAASLFVFQTPVNDGKHTPKDPVEVAVGVEFTAEPPAIGLRVIGGTALPPEALRAVVDTLGTTEVASYAD